MIGTKTAVIALTLVLSVLLPVSAMAHDEMTTACENLVLDYAYYRDRPDADGVAALFTEDATFTLSGDVWKGREAIRKRIAAGVGGPVFRHMMSTIRIERVDASTAKGVSYATVYSAPAGELPRPVKDFAALGEYHDVFKKAADGRWRIAKREFIMVMVPEQE